MKEIFKLVFCASCCVLLYIVNYLYAILRKFVYCFIGELTIEVVHNMSKF